MKALNRQEVSNVTGGTYLEDQAFAEWLQRLIDEMNRNYNRLVPAPDTGIF